MSPSTPSSSVAVDAFEFADTFVVGESVFGELVVGELVVGESVVGEPVIGDPVVGEPVVGEPVVGEPVVGEVVGEFVGACVGHGVVKCPPAFHTTCIATQ